MKRGGSRGGAAGRLGLLLTALALLAAGYLYQQQRAGRAAVPPAGAERRDDAAILAAWRDGRSGIDVESVGTVERLLADDLEGSRHQRFILRLAGGHTLLVSHNIDLAPRVPLEVGDAVGFRGRYEWNERGGVIHWTHHDPQGREAGGWLEHAGRVFR